MTNSASKAGTHLAPLVGCCHTLTEIKASCNTTHKTIPVVKIPLVNYWLPAMSLNILFCCRLCVLIGE